MLTHIHAVSVVVADQDRALAYYRDVLGFEVRYDGPFMPGSRWIEVAPPGGQTGIVLENWSGTLTPEGQSSRIIFDSTDAYADYERLKAAGVTFKEPPAEHPWGIQLEFSDLDGNQYVYVQQPS